MFKESNVIDPVATDDVTGQVKIKMFDDLPCLALSRTLTMSNGKSQETKIYRDGTC